MTPRDENATTSPEPETSEFQGVQPSGDGSQPRPADRRRTAILIAAAALAVLALMIYSGIHSRAVAESRLTRRTQQAPIPPAPVLFPHETAPTPEIVLPRSTPTANPPPP